MKERYSGGFLSEGVREKMREILLPAIQEWFNNLKSILEDQKTLIPSNIFIFGGGSLTPEIQEILLEGNWGDLPLISSPKVELIYPKSFKDIEDKSKKLTSPQDVNLTLLCYEAI